MSHEVHREIELRDAAAFKKRANEAFFRIFSAMRGRIFRQSYIKYFDATKFLSAFSGFRQQK